MPDATVIVDESGSILFANGQVKRMLGYFPHEIQGKSVELMLPERFRLPHIGHRLRFTDQRGVRAMGAGRRLFVLQNDGNERAVEVSLGPVQHGLQTLFVATIRDLPN